MKKFPMLFAAGVLTMSLTACAGGPPTMGDFMRQHATDEQALVDLQRQLAKDWARGSELVVSGEKRVKSGQAEVERGEQEIAEGTSLMQESERLFRERFPQLRLDGNK
jgi:hypothetical protein